MAECCRIIRDADKASRNLFRF